MERLNKSARDALDIYNGGACNPRAVARAVTRAIDAACEAGGGTDLRRSDAAAPARLALAQLAYLLGASFDGMGGVASDCGGAGDDVERCEAMRARAAAEATALADAMSGAEAVWESLAGAVADWIESEAERRGA